MAERYQNSRSRGQSRSRGAYSKEAGSASYGQVRRKTASGRNSSGYGPGRYHKKNRKDNNNMIAVLGVAAVIIVAGGLFFLTRHGLLKNGEAGTSAAAEVESTAFDPDVIRKDLYLDISAYNPNAEKLNLNGMNREALKQAIQDSYEWNLTVTNGNPNLDKFKMPDLSSINKNKETKAAETDANADNEGTEEITEVENPYKNISIRPEAASYTLPDLLAPHVDDEVERIFSDYESSGQKAAAEPSAESASGTETASAPETSAAKGADYVLSLPDMKSEVSDYMKQLAVVWKMEPKNGDITSFDKKSGEFVFGGSVDGYSVNAEATAAKIMEALEKCDYSAKIQTEGSKVVASDDSIKSKYTTIGSFTTKTTANAIRNKNIELAAAALNGTVVQPGEEFSFNETVGQRTAERGFGGAPAYNNGEVVEEIGGGVCQVSSTLFNAVFRSGLTTTYRRSHTFAPNYVTPGCDATVSWPGPDYKFVNNSSHAIGIRAWYADRTMNVQIYGIRILPEGESWGLTAEKVKDLPIPAPQIITPDKGKESAGTAGSEWQAYKIITKNGKEERVKDHYTSYKGHTPMVYDTTVQASIAAESAAQAEASKESHENVEEPAKSETSSEVKETKETKSENPELAEQPGGNASEEGSELVPEGPENMN